jgi:carboxylesterase
VLVLHGLTSSLGSIMPVVERLAPHGIPCATPWLRGHGTRPEDLAGVTWRDWYDDASAALDTLLAECEAATVVGLSMGGLVALHLAVERPDRLCGVVAVAPALRQAHPLAPLAEGYSRLPTTTFLSLVAYGRWLLPRLGRIHVPVLLLHSHADRVIRPDSATRIYERLTGAPKELRWFHRSGHEMLVDCEADAVLDAVEAFVLARMPTAPLPRGRAGRRC